MASLPTSAAPSPRHASLAAMGSSNFCPVSFAKGNAPSDAAGSGLGITESLEGKNFLITGGTGFLAKVLIEKILRANPDVGKVYVMIRAKDSDAASKRLQNEVVGTELFKCLQEIHGKDYHNFIAGKLVPVAGDLRESTNIGIAPELVEEIAREVDIVVNLAANTTLNERYDVAMDINTVGPFRLMNFVQRFLRLKLFMHISTVFVNGERQGLVLEKPLHMGDTIAAEMGSSEDRRTVLNIEEEIKLAFDSTKHRWEDSASFSQGMKDLGLERAKLHGWQNTYTFSKAMGEMVINSMRGEMPVVTIRPSIVESTLREPFPGWIQGNRVMDPVILYYGKGQLTGFTADDNVAVDVVPADMVVNATLASMAKHYGGAAGMHVYHVASSAVNPVTIRDLFRFFYDHFTRSPMVDAAGRPIPVSPMRLFSSMEQFAEHVMECSAAALTTPRRGGVPAGSEEDDAERQHEFRARAVARLMRLASVYEPISFYGGRFDNANTAALLAEMSPEERARFDFDVGNVDWADYIVNVHIPGLKKHVLRSQTHA